jgi:membrane associated rhomboid family serine protease
MSTLTTVLYLAVPYSAFGAGMMARGEPGLRATRAVARQSGRVPVATIALCCLVAIPSLLQLRYPRLLTSLQRDRELILQHGEWWRVLTALVVQDGGAAGLIGNLLVLALVGVVAERIWGSWRVLALFFATGILSEFVALAWQPIGAGNSIGNFGLAAGVLLCCLLRATAIPPRVLAGVGIAGGLALLVMRDIHGAALTIGLCLSAGLLAIG